MNQSARLSIPGGGKASSAPEEQNRRTVGSGDPKYPQSVVFCPWTSPDKGQTGLEPGHLQQEPVTQAG